MTFKPEELLDTDVQFTADDNINFKLVEGGDQWVYWKGCNGLSTVENGKKEKQDVLTGKVKLEPGISLYFAGGQVKER